MKRLLFLLLSFLVIAAPASARRRHRVRHPASRAAAASTAAPLRNVILLVASGYSAGDWDDLRASLKDGFTAWDRMPDVCIALPPQGKAADAAMLASALGSGLSGNARPDAPSLPALVKASGRSVALVGDAAISDSLPAGVAVPGGTLASSSMLERLTHGCDVIMVRTVPPDEAGELVRSGVTVVSDPHAILMAETTPFVAAAPAAAVPFDTLAFRALHLAAKNPKGFLMVTGAIRSGATAREFNAAVMTARNYAARDPHALVLVVLAGADGAIRVHAEGQDARRFHGTLMLTDVPKIIAGLAGIKGMGRDFSALFTPNGTGEAPRGKGMIALPW